MNNKINTAEHACIQLYTELTSFNSARAFVSCLHAQNLMLTILRSIKEHAVLGESDNISGNLWRAEGAWSAR